MSLLTTYRNTLHGAACTGGTFTVVRNCSGSGATMTDSSANAGTVTAIGTPTTLSAGGRDGSSIHTFDGTTQAFHFGSLDALYTAMDAGEFVTLVFDMVHSSTAGRDEIFGAKKADGTSEIALAFNVNANYNVSAYGFGIRLRDAAGTYRTISWNFNDTRMLNDGLKKRIEVAFSKTAGWLRVDGSPPIAGTVTNFGTFTTFSGTGNRWLFGGTGSGGGNDLANAFIQSAGNVLIGTGGRLTDAQSHADLGIHVSESRSTDGTPLTRVWRADTNVYNGATTPPAARDDDATAWSSTDGQMTMEEDSASDPGSGGPQLIPTYCPEGPFGTAPCIVADNVFSKNAYDDIAYAATLGGHRRQTYKSAAFPGLTFHGSNCSLWFAGRVPCGNPLGNTIQVLAACYDGGVLKFGLGFMNGRLVIVGPGTTTRDALTTDVRDCPNGPSLIYAEVTIDPFGNCTIRVNNQSGTTTSTLNVGAVEIDELHFFGTQSSDGGDCAHCFAYEIGLAETVSTDSERTTRAQRIFAQYGATGETLTPRKRMLFIADSLVTQFSAYGRSALMLLPAACVNDTDWISQDQPMCSMDHTSNDFASHTMNATAKKSSTATWHGIMIVLGGNDRLAGNTASAINTELGTAVASLSGFNWIAACGVHDSDNNTAAFQTAYQDLINARVGSTLDAAIRQRTTDGLLVADTIHGAGEPYQQQLADDLWNNSAGGSGGGLSAVLGGSISKRLFIINND